MFKTCVIISGGNGTRMLPLTNYIPKASILVSGKKLSSHSIHFLRKYDVKNLFMTYNHLSQNLFNDFKTEVDAFINTENKDNSYFLTSTFLRDLDEPIIVIPCDIIFEIDFKKLYEEYLLLNNPEVMLVPIKILEGVEGDYVHFDGNNILTLNRSNYSEYYLSGIQIINPKKLNTIMSKKHHNFYNIWDELIMHNKLKLSNTQPTKWRAYDKINDVI